LIVEPNTDREQIDVSMGKELLLRLRERPLPNPPNRERLLNCHTAFGLYPGPLL